MEGESLVLVCLRQEWVKDRWCETSWERWAMTQLGVGGGHRSGVHGLREVCSDGGFNMLGVSGRQKSIGS